jgi:membrane protease YdiL (CAAX protease family)
LLCCIVGVICARDDSLVLYSVRSFPELPYLLAFPGWAADQLASHFRVLDQTVMMNGLSLQSATTLEAGRAAEARCQLETVARAHPRGALAWREVDALGPGPARSPLLQRAVVALNTGHRPEARRLLEAAVQTDPRSERAWLWLAEAVDSDEERRFCLTRVLSINRRNALARRRLEPLGPGPARSPLLQPAVAALEAGRRGEARRLLEVAVRTSPRSERGWLWLAEAVDSEEERRFCLARVLSVNRRNALARRRLDALGPGPTRSPIDGWEGLREPQPEWQSTVVPGRFQPIREALCDHPIPTALGYLVALTVAELLTALIEPRVGLVLHGVVLMALLLHTALTWGHPNHRFLLSLTFAPLIRLLSLSMPLAGFPLIYWYFIVSVPLFVAAAIALRTLGFSRIGIGLNLKALPLQVLVALTGMSLGYIEYRILQPAPLTSNLGWEEAWLPALILLVCTGFAEELIFRGMMQEAATQVCGQVWGVLYVAVLFAVLHVGYQSLPDVLFVFNVALFFGLTKTVTGSILGISLAHGMTNILLFLTMPFGVNHFDLIAHHLYGS